MKSTSTKPVLELDRTFAASPERVFAAWTQPEELKQWFAPSPDTKNPVVDVDLRVGGRYRIVMESPTGDRYTVSGEFKEVSRPDKLAYTWSWEHEPKEETLVTVTFHAAPGQGTRMKLVHERFATEESRNKHEEGWTGCLVRLSSRLG